MMLIKNAVVYTMEEEQVLENCDILLDQGKIVQIGHGIEAEGVDVLDATGLYVTPGLIDAHCHAGGAVSMQGDDVNEITSPVTPELDVIYSINIHENTFQELHRAGVTTCCLVPGSSNVICGTGIVSKTAGKNSIFDLTLLRPAVMKCALGRMPKRCYGKRGRMPVTRMGTAAILRNTLQKAKNYMRQKKAAEEENTKPPLFDERSEALIPVLKKEIPLKVHCGQFDMLTVIEVAKEFGCDYTLEHAWGCDMYVDELVEGGGSICFGPIGIPEGYGEIAGGDVGFVRELDDKGLNVCLITDGPIYGPDVLLISAGEAVRCGVDHMRALAMITYNAAKALHVDDRLGSIRVGKDADIVIFDSIPALEMGARVLYTIIEGEVVYSANE